MDFGSGVWLNHAVYPDLWSSDGKRRLILTLSGFSQFLLLRTFVQKGRVRLRSLFFTPMRLRTLLYTWRGLVVGSWWSVSKNWLLLWVRLVVLTSILIRYYENYGVMGCNQPWKYSNASKLDCYPKGECTTASLLSWLNRFLPDSMFVPILSFVTVALTNFTQLHHPNLYGSRICLVGNRSTIYWCVREYIWG